MLRELLGPACGPISDVDRDAFYTRPEDALFAYDARVRHLVHDGAPSVGVWAELPVFSSREQADAWLAYVAILKHAFVHHPVQIICGYDAREHSEAVLEGAWHTHPLVLGDASRDKLALPRPRPGRTRADPGRRRAARLALAAPPT